MEMSEARRHRLMAEYRMLKRRMYMSGRSLEEAVAGGPKSGEDEIREPALAERLGEIVSQRIRKEMTSMRVDPAAVAREVTRMVEKRLAAIPAGTPPEKVEEQVTQIPVDDIQSMLDRILGK
jgi:hypothetical protein